MAAPLKILQVRIDQVLANHRRAAQTSLDAGADQTLADSTGLSLIPQFPAIQLATPPWCEHVPRRDWLKL